MLSRLSAYLKVNRRAGLVDMVNAMDASAEALRDMLAVLERKGRVRRLPTGTTCSGGCHKCAPESIELYEWCAGSADARNTHKQVFPIITVNT